MKQAFFISDPGRLHWNPAKDPSLNRTVDTSRKGRGNSARDMMGKPHRRPAIQAFLMMLLVLTLLLSGCGGTTTTGGIPASDLKFPDFNLYDLEGNEVDQTLFAEHDLTMINIWGTFCPPCIEEMPDLGELDRTLADGYNVALVGLVVDVRDAETLQLARAILSDADADHLNLLMGEALVEFLSRYEYVPTTLFIDKNGYVVGDPVVGGRSHDEYLKEIKSRLP